MTPRAPTRDELPALAKMWERRWHDAHADCSPPALIALRTTADFQERMGGFFGDMWVIGPIGAPQGFVALTGHLIDQLYVDETLAGTGAALTLLRHGEAMIKARGHKVAELWCNTGNLRAARFYEKSGWVHTATKDAELASVGGTYVLPCLIFQRDIE